VAKIGRTLRSDIKNFFICHLPVVPKFDAGIVMAVYMTNGMVGKAREVGQRCAAAVKREKLCGSSGLLLMHSLSLEISWRQASAMRSGRADQLRYRVPHLAAL
jgi:hypothetical protein